MGSGPAGGVLVVAFSPDGKLLAGLVLNAALGWWWADPNRQPEARTPRVGAIRAPCPPV